MNNPYIGKTCPYCQSPLKPGAQIVACNKCEMPHHMECWQANGGCTTFSCEGNAIEDFGIDSDHPLNKAISVQRGNKSNNSDISTKIILRYGLGIWIAAVIVAAFYWVKPATGFGLPESVGNVSRIVIFHVPAAMVMVLWFAAGAFFAFKYLTHRRPEDDRKSVTALELGMLFGVLATVTGSIFAYQAWNSAWNWDPRETSVLAQLLIYIAYFALRSGISDREQRGRVSGAYALFALATVPFLIFILPRIPAFSSIHPVGTLTNRGGLDIPYKVTLYSALVGYIWLGIRLFRTQVAAGNIEAKLEEIDGLENSSSASVAPRVVRRVPVSSEDGTKN